MRQRPTKSTEGNFHANPCPARLAAHGAYAIACALALVAPVAQAQTISDLYPSHGPCAGSPLAIVGSNFTGVTQVTVGGNAAMILHAAATVVVVQTPPGFGTAKEVKVFVGANVSNSKLYDYDAPRINSVTPRNASTSGGTSVEIVGENFLGLSFVQFGGSVAFPLPPTPSNTSITVSVPAGVGLQQDVVVSGGGQASNACPFNYNAPQIDSISPGSGPTQGNTPVTITGQNLFGATSVLMGGQLMPIDSVSHGQIIARTPVGEGLFRPITVTTPSGTSQPAFFNYSAPTINNVSPLIGPTVGGTVLTVTGSNLGIGNPIEVTIGGRSASVLTQPAGGTQVTVSTPAGAGQNLPVLLRTLSGTAVAPQLFSYAPPSIDNANPPSIPTTGGVAVTLSGQNLFPALSVFFNDQLANIATNSHTQVIVTAPAGYGTSTLRVTTPSGTSLPFAFSYDPPTITSMMPTTGPGAGNTQVTLSGQNLFGVTAVLVGTRAAQILSATHGSIVFLTPSGFGLNLPVQVSVEGQQAFAPDTFSYDSGACCVHNFGSSADPCFLESEATCLARGNGTFLGVGVPCGAPCSVTASCCLSSGACLRVTVDDCAALGGVSGAPGSECAAANCLPACTCPGDLNLDLQIDGADIQDFVDALLSGTPCQP